MIRIVTESMSDFTQEEAKAADLIVMPLPIRFGMEEYWDDGVSLTQDDFYARLRVAKELPKTSQVPVEHYRKCFNRLLENPEDEVLVITGSSKLSGCYQSACIAREACHDPARVTVLDSLNATCAEYMLVDQALRYRREGVSDMPTMLAKLRDVMAHYKIIGMAADLKYLVMGGRLSPLVGKLGNRLSIKPTLKIEDGIVSKAGMVHGMAKGRACEKVSLSYIGFKIGSGYHDIKIVYKAPYQKEGMIFSGIGCIMLLQVMILDIKKRKK